MLGALSVTGPADGSVEAGGGAGEGGVGRGREGRWARGRGGGRDDGDPQGVVVPTVPPAPPLGLLEDVLRVVHGDQPGVRDEVR